MKKKAESTASCPRPTAYVSGRKANLRRLLGYMKRYWYMYLLVGILMMTAILLNAAIPAQLGKIVDTVIQNDAPQPERIDILVKIIMMLALVGIGHAVVNYTKEYLSDILGSRIGGDMRRDLFRHIQRLDVGFFDRNNTGELMARIKDDIDKIWFILGFGGMLISEAVIHTVITLGCMLNISPILTVLPLIVMVTVAVIALKMEKQLDKCYDAISEQNAKLTTIAQENLSGVRTVKAFAREEHEIDKFSRNNQEYYDLNIRLSKVQIKHQPYISMASHILVLLVVIAGGVLIIFDRLSYGGLVAYVEYSYNIIWPMGCIAWLGNELASALASDRKVRRILREQPVIVDPEKPETLEKVRGHVRFDSVSFAVDDKTILEDVSFDLPAGKTLGIMGMTGTGKSTVINLLERFYDVTGGSIKLDGVDVRDLTLSQLRSSVAVVMQDVFLFSDTIAENIRMGGRNSISDEDMVSAAKDACAAEFINGLAEGYDTIIGERGVGLSGGQKQRISIARALAKKAPVLILDDATSALDMETEYDIQQALQALTDTTRIIVAHRISAVKDADEIIVLEDGRVAERGTHSQLMALRGRYFATYVAQYNTEVDMVG